MNRVSCLHHHCRQCRKNLSHKNRAWSEKSSSDGFLCWADCIRRWWCRFFTVSDISKWAVKPVTISVANLNALGSYAIFSVLAKYQYLSCGLTEPSALYAWCLSTLDALNPELGPLPQNVIQKVVRSSFYFARVLLGYLCGEDVEAA